MRAWPLEVKINSSVENVASPMRTLAFLFFSLLTLSLKLAFCATQRENKETKKRGKRGSVLEVHAHYS